MQEAIGQFTSAVRQGDLEGFKALWEIHSEVLDQRRLSRYCRYTLPRDDVRMLALLAKLGADVHAGEGPGEPEGLLYRAAGEKAVNCVRWLLEQGVQVNHEVEGQVRCLALSSAARTGNLDLVKMLVKAGANVNASWMGQSALDFAVLYNQPEIEAYLRSCGAEGAEAAAGSAEDRLAEDEAAADPILSHMERHFGPSEPLSLQEIIASPSPVTIHVIDLGEGKLLFTSGMSANPVTLPAEGETPQFAELMILLPGAWPMDQKSLADDRYAWPLEWMRRIATSAPEERSWLRGRFGIVGNGEPPQPFATNTKLSCLLVLEGSSNYCFVDLPNGRRVCFYELSPLHAEERDLQQSQGIKALLQAFHEHGVQRTVDIARPSVVA